MINRLLTHISVCRLPFAVSRSAFYVLLFSFCLLLYNCTGISLSQKINVSDGDWLEAGGAANQQNISYFNLQPPLDLKWSFDIDAGVGFSAIAVSDAVVLVNSLAGDLIAFDISGGGKLGKLNYLGRDAGTTPLINGNNVIFSFAGDRDYSLISYDLENGKNNWRIDLGFLQTSPIMHNGFVYAGSLDGIFFKVDAKTDSIMWKYDAKAQIHSTCAIDSDYAVFGADNGGIYCVNLTDGSLKWKTMAGGPVVATPLIFDNKVFVGSYDSCYYCLNLSDGVLVWKKNIHTKILGGSSLFNAQNVIFGGVDGNLNSLKASDGSSSWVVHTKGVIGSSPLCSGPNIYFTSYDFNIYCIEGSSGSQLWNYELEGKSRTSPVIWRDYLVVAADKVVYCFIKKPQG